MSGGSLDYVYGRVNDAADAILAKSKRPLHRALAKHLYAVSEALHDLEWMFSCDTSPGDEDAAIRKVVTRTEEIAAARENLMEAISQAQDVLRATDDPHD